MRLEHKRHITAIWHVCPRNLNYRLCITGLFRLNTPVISGRFPAHIAAISTRAKLDGITRSLAHPKWRMSEATSKQGSVLAVAVWVGLLKWDYYFVMILGTIEQKETLKILTNIVMSNVRKMARDVLTSILGWANFVCAPGLDRLTRLGMD